MRVILLFAVLVLAGCATPMSQRHLALEPIWRVGGLANPESVALSADQAFLYVTNVNGDPGAQDGNGFLSRISVDGRLVQRDFATGLNGPKGIALHDGMLHVADIDEVVTIDAGTGRILQRTAIPGATFLNDLAIAPDEALLISDSATARIFALRNGVPEIWLEHELLSAVNGLLPERDRLIVTTMRGLLLAIDYQTRAVTVLAEGLGNADGVARVGPDQYLVSEWPGLMHSVAIGGARATLLDTRAEPRLLNDFLLADGVLYQPHWEPSELGAYRVARVRG